MTARSALDAVRPTLARMDASRGPESTRTDLLEVWSAVESALRSLTRNSAQSGQALIREARSRQLLTFDQANALVAFLTTRERLDAPGYTPTDADVNVARSTFLKFDAGLMESGGAGLAEPYGAPSYGSAAPTPPRVGSKAPAAEAPAVPLPSKEPRAKERRTRRVLLPLGIVVGVILVLGASAYVLFARGGGTNALFAQGVQAYQRGDKVTASSDFERATREAPSDPMPHVYLARMAREVGNYTIANQELQAALRADRRNLTGLREYGAFFLSQGNYDQARVWYLHALEVDPNDATSEGWLGCTLMKLGRADEGHRWLGRAGTGPWSACASSAAPMAPGNIRP